MDIAGLAPAFNYTMQSLLHILPEVTYPGLFLLLFGSVVGTLGNVMVIGAVFLQRTLRHAGNLFVVNLALADLCVTTIVDPLGITGVMHGEIYFEQRPALCEFVASTCLTACYCSLLSIASVAVNRCIFICNNASYNRFFNRRSCVALCVGLWIVSWLLQFPNFVGWGDFAYDRKNFACVWNRMADRSYTIFFSCCAVVAPSIVILICYFRIFVHVRQAMARVRHLQMGNARDAQRGSPNSVRPGGSAASIRLARTLFIVFAVFAFCWAPYATFVCLDWDDSFPIHMHAYAILFAHTNSSVNFIVYGLSNKEFRVGYRAVCKRLLRLICGSRCSPEASVGTTNLSSRMEVEATSARMNATKPVVGTGQV